MKYCEIRAEEGQKIRGLQYHLGGIICPPRLTDLPKFWHAMAPPGTTLLVLSPPYVIKKISIWCEILKVPGRSMSWIVAYPSIFQLLMKAKFDAYVLGQNGPKLNR